MVSFTASTRQPPAGGPKATVEYDDLLRRLRLGDRDAFVRYYRMFRAPAYRFAWRLVRDERRAVAATREALVAVLRRAILNEDATDLEALTYAAALAACEERACDDIAGGARPAAAAPGPRRAGRGAAGAMEQGFDAALESLGLRPRAALLLHDLAGLGATRSAAVLGVDEATAAALLFKAREEFRTALLEGNVRAVEGCLQAEEAAAAAVGLGMSEHERSRLRRHADYCRPCRRVMKEWPAGTDVGLAVALAEPPLPQALAATPVFDEAPAPPAAAPAYRRALAVIGRGLRARTTAWAAAAACLALAAGIVVAGVGVQPQALMQSVGPAIRLIVAPPAGEKPAAARAHGRSTTSAHGAVGISEASAAARPAAAQSTPTPASRTLPSGSSPSPSASAGGQPGDEHETAQVAGDGSAAQQDGASAQGGDKASAQAGKVAARAAQAAAKAASTAARSDGAEAHAKAGKAHIGKSHDRAQTGKAHDRAQTGKALGSAHVGKAASQGGHAVSHGASGARGHGSHESGSRGGSAPSGKAHGSSHGSGTAHGSSHGSGNQHGSSHGSGNQDGSSHGSGNQHDASHGSGKGH